MLTPLPEYVRIKGGSSLFETLGECGSDRAIASKIDRLREVGVSGFVETLDLGESKDFDRITEASSLNCTGKLMLLLSMLRANSWGRDFRGEDLSALSAVVPRYRKSSNRVH